MESEAKECRGCRFYDEVNPQTDGLCRRHAPRTRLLDAEAVENPRWGMWPFVNVDDWCGEWRAIPLPLTHELLIEFEPDDHADLHEENSANAVPPSAHGNVAREDDGEVDGL